MSKNYDKTSLIYRYGEDLTENEYIVNPAIARDDEIKKLILTLLSPEKSAILVGKPGIGKTAIVEGLAYLIQKNEVPDAIKGFKIMKINITSLLGTTEQDGDTVSKVQALVDELEQEEKTIVFIDEIHNIIGTGKAGGSLDFANMLKPSLGRGTIKLIGATTTEEFDFYIIKDRPFLRRFEKIEVAEPDQETTVKIVMGTIPKIEKKTGVKNEYSDFVTSQYVKFMVNMTSEYKRIFEATSKYPDITLALLTKAFSFAIYDNCPVLRFKHIWEAIKSCESIYPDSLVKEKAAFKKEFETYLAEEGTDTFEA